MDNIKNFALIGAAGFIAPRHMRAIKDTGNRLIAALDKSDSVGIIDSYFPDCAFFTEYERFDRHIEKLFQENKTSVDYVSICSPNYLHDAHVRFALRAGAHAICEKPLVLNPWNLDSLQTIEQRLGKRVYTILQLRLHPTIIELKNKIAASKKNDYKVDLTYITPRGNWYLHSWKGESGKSGGLATNIGIHFFDMLAWIFGQPSEYRLDMDTPQKASGVLKLQRATVNWFLSIDSRDLEFTENKGLHKAFRSITVDGEALKFSDGFTDLHTESYRQILAGRGFGIEDSRTAVTIAHTIRNSRVGGLGKDSHPFALKTQL